MEHKENTLEKKVAIVFAQYPKPENDILYSTHDERIFLSEGYAKSHAFKLKDSEVTPHRRSDYQDIKVSEDKVTNPDKFAKPVAQVDSQQLDLEREALKANYLKLYGKAAQGNIGIDKLKVKIAEKEAELAAAQSEKDGADKDAGQGAETTGSETEGAGTEGSGAGE